MKKLHLLMATLLIVVAGAICSCSKSSSELTGNIPAASDMVMKFNVKQVVENAGGNVDGNKITLPEKLSSIVNTYGIGQYVDMITDGMAGIDITRIYYFMYEKEQYALAKITDEKQLDDAMMQAGFSRSSVDGFGAYSKDDDVYFYIKDSILWVADSADDITKAMKAAKNSNINNDPGFARFLESDNAFDFVANMSGANFGPFRGDRLLANINFKNQAMTGEVVIADKDGKLNPFGEAFGVIDTDFLRYVPEDAQTIFAIGNVESAGLRSLMGMAAAQMAPLGDLLTTLDGTVGGFFTLNPSLATMDALQRNDFAALISNMRFLIMAHYPQSTINSTLDFIRANYSIGGGAIENYGKDGFTVMAPVEGSATMPLYFDDPDGNLAIGNYPFNANEQNSFTDKFLGRRAAMYAHGEPNELSRSFGADYSSEGCIWLESDRVKFETRLLNTDKKFLESIVDLCTNPVFISRVMQQVQKSKSSYNSYGYDYDFDDDDEDPGCEYYFN